MMTGARGTVSPPWFGVLLKINFLHLYTYRAGHGPVSRVRLVCAGPDRAGS